MAEDAEIRRRNVPSDDPANEQVEDAEKLMNEAGSGISVPQPAPTTPANDPTPECLKVLPPRWRNWVIRGTLTLVMISTFCGIIYMGPFWLSVLVLSIQVKCFHEIINIGYVVYRSHDLPWFRSLSWYFLVAANYFFYGEFLCDYFGTFLVKGDFLRPFITYHRFISFSVYIFGLCLFVLSLVKTYYVRQFTMFGWTHITLLIVVTQSHLIIQNIFQGLIWFIVPTSMVICNDIFAYIFGFFFGKTSLIKLSPKKTWEGFIGALFSTMVWSFFVSYPLCSQSYFTCPFIFDSDSRTFSLACETDSLFTLTDYTLPLVLQKLFVVLKLNWTTMTCYPFQLHSVVMAIFCSLIGPFGGFFASGFKRAFKIKDFSDTIPGHGGIVDRFDCQYLMATFTHVYLSSFIRAANPQKLMQHILSLEPADQLLIFTRLKNHLVKVGLVQAVA